MLGAPIWVWILFVFLLYIGIRRCYRRVSNVKRLGILPLVFFYFSIKHNYALFLQSPWSISAYIIALVLGICFGFSLLRAAAIRVDRENHLIEQPGDWRLLVMILAIFAIEFGCRYLQASDSSLASSFKFSLTVDVITALIVGLSIGKNAKMLYVFFCSKNSESLLARTTVNKAEK